MKNKWLWILVVFFIILVLFVIRAVSLREVDDVNPIMCNSGDDMYIGKADILWIVPLYKNESISNNSNWISNIENMNKTLGLHGVYHTYNEFGTYRDEEYLNLGINEFERAFGHKPRMFKAPQLKLSKENREMLVKEGFEIKGNGNQLFHKVYHCNDTGIFKNWFIDLF